MKDWHLLKDKKIIDLFIGDTCVNDEMYYDCRMPYMSLSDIKDFGSTLGMKFGIRRRQQISRQTMMSRVLDYAIEHNEMNRFFKNIFDLSRFKDCKSLIYRDPILLYYDTINGVMNSINNRLIFDKSHIIYDFDTMNFSFVDNTSNIVVEYENVALINREYIVKLIDQINKTINDADYESTITKSRTVLEEILIYGIELKNGYYKRGDIKEEYKTFRSLYNMHFEKNVDSLINNLLSGFEKIVNSISELRNSNSDSHGVGSSRIVLAKKHAVLVKNSVMTISEFLLDVINDGEL